MEDPPNPQQRNWRALKYLRRNGPTGMLGYEYDPDSGIRGGYLVSDEAIHNVAQAGGDLEDFAKYQNDAKD